MKYQFYFFALVISCLCVACGGDSDEDEMVFKEITSYDTGIFVVNQGNNEVQNGSVSFYQRDCQQHVNGIYGIANPSPRIGNQLQDIVIVDNQAFILSAETNQLEVVNATSFEHIKTITGFAQPKKVIAVNSNKLYVSQWGADGLTGSVEVVDLNTLSISKSIPTAPGAGGMTKAGPAVYVCNSGGFGIDSTLTKIDGTSDQVIKTIEVGYNPVDVVFDADANVWALCSGVLINFGNPQAPENTPGSLVKIEGDVATNEIPLVAGARNMVINTAGDKIYFVNNNWTYEQPINQTALPLVPFFDFSFNGYAIDPSTGHLVAANGLDFKEPGEVSIYDLAGPTLINKFQVGIVPVAFGFR